MNEHAVRFAALVDEVGVALDQCTIDMKIVQKLLEIFVLLVLACVDS